LALSEIFGLFADGDLEEDEISGGFARRKDDPVGFDVLGALPKRILAGNLGGDKWTESSIRGDDLHDGGGHLADGIVVRRRGRSRRSLFNDRNDLLQEGIVFDDPLTHHNVLLDNQMKKTETRLHDTKAVGLTGEDL